MDNGEIKAAVAEIMKLRPTPKKAEAAKVEHRRTRQQLADYQYQKELQALREV